MYGRSTCRISALDPRHHKRGSAARHAARAVTPLHYHSVMHRKQGRRRFSRTVFWHVCRRLNMTALSPSSCAAMQCLCPVPLSPAACWSRCSLSEFSAESVRRMVVFSGGTVQRKAMRVYAPLSGVYTDTIRGSPRAALCSQAYLRRADG